MTRVLRKSRPVYRPTAYEILSMPPASTVDQLHDAYLKIAFAIHPDRGGDAEKFKVVALAWGQLKMKEERKRYDQQLKMEGILNCLTCKGCGIRSYFDQGCWRKDVLCLECRGTGRKKEKQNV